MLLTKRINTFIKESAELSAKISNGCTSVDEAITEFTNQILEDDYFCVVNFAYSQGIAIPLKLRNAIDIEYISKIFE